MLRKRLMLDESSIACGRVYLHIASLGYHELYVNKERVGDHVLQPAVSQLDKRALRVDYDITGYVHEGDNEIVIMTGQGWGRVYGTPAAVQAKLTRRITDDLAEVIEETDSTWQTSPSPYSYTGSWLPLQFGGERYDARANEKWRPASVYDAKNILVTPQEFGGNRIVDTVAPVEWISHNKTSMLLDFGRVVTGWAQIDFPPMPEGTEMLITYLDNLQSEYKETDIYIARGRGEERFSNRFHTHSFRYISIQTAYTDIQLSRIKARALQISAVDPKGGATFWCNDERLNAIHDMVKYTLCCLTFSGYMVDCPHLERMGYGGDGNASTMTLQTMWDVSATYRNWMTAWGDAMEPDGELPYVAPAYRTGGGPYWSSFIIQAPWRTYLNYGDTLLIAEHYSRMKRWLDFIERNSSDGLLQPWPDNERHTWFLGDWLAPEGVDIGGESVLHVNNCVISECLADMERMALLLGGAERRRLSLLSGEDLMPPYIAASTTPKPTPTQTAPPWTRPTPC